MNVCISDAESVVVFEQVLKQEHLDDCKHDHYYYFGHSVLLDGVLVLHNDLRVDPLSVLLELLLLGDVMGFAGCLHQRRVQLVHVALRGE
jgi:hypothetical protein